MSGINNDDLNPQNLMEDENPENKEETKYVYLD